MIKKINAVIELIVNNFKSKGCAYTKTPLAFVRMPASGLKYFMSPGVPVKVVRSKNIPEPQKRRVLIRNQILSISLI